MEPHTKGLICEVEMMWTIQNGHSMFEYTPRHPRRGKCCRVATERTKRIPEGFTRLALEGKLSEQTIRTVVYAGQVTGFHTGAPTKGTTSDLNEVEEKAFKHYWDAFPCFQS